MITQNYMLNFIAKAPQPAGMEVKKADSTGKASFPQFKDVLDKTVSRSAERNPVSKSPEQAVKPGNNQDKNEVRDNGQAKTFREAVNNGRHEVKAEKTDNNAKVHDAEGTEKETTEGKKETKVKSKADAVIESLAQVMGMKSEDLLKLLNSLNIKPEDLVQDSKMTEAMSKLSDVMGLDTQQKQALTEIVKAVVTQVDQVFQQTDPKPASEVHLKNTDSTAALKTEDTKSREGWVRLGNVKVEVVDQKPEISEISKLMAGFKLKLGEMTQKLQQNPQQLMNEISSEVKELLAGENQQTQPTEAVEEQDAVEMPKVPVKDSQTANGSDTKDAGTEPKKEDVKAAVNEDDGSKKELVKDFKETGVRKAVEVKTDTENTGTAQINEAVTNQTQKPGAAAEAVKLQKEVHVPKNEIISQVLEKAKVVLNGDKSEMVMDLKPDNLGKLALKVVTERGVVMAKFVAENEQVKAVLESNMQLLKDSLEKQGLAVQGFSVSVGQDRQKGFEQGRETGNNTNATADRIQAAGERMVGVAEIPGSMQRANPYNWSDSRINLTA